MRAEEMGLTPRLNVAIRAVLKWVGMNHGLVGPAQSLVHVARGCRHSMVEEGPVPASLAKAKAKAPSPHPPSGLGAGYKDPLIH
jgi:hypothetical protein